MNTKLLTALGLALAMAGCASTPKSNPTLESARSIVEAAQADPNAAKYAPLDLQTAKNDLAAADAAFARHDDVGIEQPAYLATQNARLAQLRGAAKADDARVAAGQAERDAIVLAARTNQVDSANRATDAAKIARDQATENSARLQAEVDALKAKPTDRGLVLTLGDVLFNSGSATLSPGAGRNLDRLVQFLTEHPDRLVQIDGFTDSVGADSYNLDLSQRRADAVREVLLSRGITSARVGTQGYGKAYPVADNSESGGRQLNRRVEVVIGDDQGDAIARRGG
jgi:outer membrane protein OmpA-like peptidoglycan-associated protein